MKEESSSLPTDLATSIRVHLQRVREEWADHPAEVAQAAEEVGAIPLLLDFGGFVALRPDGSVISVRWDSPRGKSQVVSARLRDIALMAGANRYPELEKLLPKRDAHSPPCPECGGSGVHPMAAARRIENLMCSCGGYGWIPDYWGDGMD